MGTTKGWGMDLVTLLAIAVVSSVVLYMASRRKNKQDCAPWAWNSGFQSIHLAPQRIALDQVKFPPAAQFLWGASSLQSAVVPSSDLQLLRDLRLNALRITVNWAEIEPRAGEVDPAAIDRYSVALDAMIAAGVAPVLQIVSCGIPQWLRDEGGLLTDDAVDKLVNHAKVLFGAFRGKVGHWLTIDDIMTTVDQFHIADNLSDHQCCQLIEQLLKAHTRIYATIKQMIGGAQAQVGLVMRVTPCVPWRWWHPADRSAASRMERSINPALQLVEQGSVAITYGSGSLAHSDPQGPRSSDFVGLAYTTCRRVQFDFGTNGTLRYGAHELLTDDGHLFFPEGIHCALQSLNSTLKLPVLIVENSVADSNDSIRKLFLQRSLFAVSRAMSEGCQVLGYLHAPLHDLERETGVKGTGLCVTDQAAGVARAKTSVEYLTHVIQFESRKS